MGEVAPIASLRHQWAKRREILPEFIEQLRDWITPNWKAAYGLLFDAFPKPLSDRIECGVNLTLVHGDTHAGNFLIPHDPGSRRCYVIDWSTYHRWFGAKDVAYFMSTWWTPRLRRIMEHDMARQYLDRVVEYGVSDYGWEDCWRDYRLSVIETALHTVHIPIPWDMAWLWYPHFEQTMSAFQDPRCGDLLH